MTRDELCLLAFPRAWRERYGREVLALLAEEPRPPRSTGLDLLRAGAVERTRVSGPVALRRAGAAAPMLLAAVIGTSAALAPPTPGRLAGRPATASPTAAGTPTVIRRSDPVVPRRTTTPARRPASPIAVRVPAGRDRGTRAVTSRITVHRLTGDRTVAVGAVAIRRVRRLTVLRDVRRVTTTTTGVHRLVGRRTRVTVIAVTRATAS